MGMKVEHDRPNNELHLIFEEDRIVVTREWCAQNAIIYLAGDGAAVEVTILNYYTEPQWLFDQNFVEYYNLQSHIDDLRLIWQEFFAPKQYGVKAIHYEGPDGEEVIVSVGHDLYPGSSGPDA